MNKPVITKMVNEEIKNFLNEAAIVGDDRFKFKQRLNNSSFANYESFTSEFDSQVTGSDIVVSWGISFWTNMSGIENFIVDVEKVEGMFMLELRDIHSDAKKQETSKNIGDFQWKFVIKQADLMKGSSLYISALSFDFQNKTCSVAF
jgi:hypothetical protein